jgi:surface antigen
MHRLFRSLFLAIALASGAGLLVPPDPALADEDCAYQILEGAADRERIAWEDTASATRYQLTPVRSFYRSGRACRELVTQGVHRYKLPEVRRTACRDQDGAWRIVD